MQEINLNVKQSGSFLIFDFNDSVQYLIKDFIKPLVEEWKEQENEPFVFEREEEV